MKKLCPVVALVLIFSACASEEESEMMLENDPEAAQNEFFDNLTSLCGESFEGAATYPDDPGHVLVDTRLVATIVNCTDTLIEIDLVRDGDTWHTTWVVEKREDGLHLYHDHIGDKEYDDGEEPLTGYGGYADDRGTATLQVFPADDHTAEILPEAETNVWMMDLDLEEGRFVYYLERHDEPRFRAELYVN